MGLSNSVKGVSRLRMGMISGLEWLGELSQLLAETVLHVLRGKVLARELVSQMRKTGVQSLPIVLIVTAFSGMVLALHTGNQLKRLGAEGLVGGLVSVSSARELAPVLTAIVVAARVGSAMAAELGSMVVTEQVDALRSLGVSPVHYLVVPRFLALLVMLPILTIFANASSVAGGYGVAVYAAGVNPNAYLTSARTLLTGDDLLLGIVKTFVFGAIVALVGCHQGLATRGGAAGVGKSTTTAVVHSIVLVYAADYFLSDWLFGTRPVNYG